MINKIISEIGAAKDSPSRNIDTKIWFALNDDGWELVSPGHVKQFWEDAPYLEPVEIPHYTGRIDDAVVLYIERPETIPSKPWLICMDALSKRLTASDSLS